MAAVKTTNRYILGAEADVQGKAWHKGDSVFYVPLTGDKEGTVDLFLTPHREYARRGSRAPVHRAPTEHVRIEGDTLTLLITDSDEEN